jgi:hypothetical protein
MSTFQEDTITLRKQELKVKLGFLPHTDLKFYPENPRIYSIVWKDESDEPSQEEIFNALSKTEHVRETLIPSIKSNGGLIEPVLVRKNIVLEGNSRLAAYRILSLRDPEQWKFIRVRILPDAISDSEVFTLLGEFHIVGKKDWQPFEQAGYLYRRFKLHGADAAQLDAEVRLGKSKILHLIQVYSFMLEIDDRNPARWSYYDELLKKKFDNVRKVYPQFNQRIVELIKSEEIIRAADIRDELRKIVKVGGNTLKKFLSGQYSFDEAAEDSRKRGAGNYYSNKLGDFRRWLADEQVERELPNVNADEKKSLVYELEKIEKRVKQLAAKVKAH